MTRIFFSKIYNRIYLLFIFAALPGAFLSGGLSSALAAQEEGYVPPDGMQSLDNIMAGDSNNRYGLESLVAQEPEPGTASPRNSNKESGSRSIIDEIKERPDSSTAARKAIRSENRKLKSELATLTLQLSELKTKLEKSQGPSQQTAASNAATIKSVTTRAETAETSARALNQQVKDLQQKLVVAADLLKTREATLEQIKVQLSDLKASGNKSYVRVNQLGADLALRDRELQTSKELLARQAEQLSLLKSTLADENTKRTNDAKVSASRVTELEHKAAESIEALETAREQLKDAQSTNQKNSSELASVREKLTTVTGEKEKADTMLASVREQLKIAVSQASNSVSLDTPVRQQAYVVGQAMASSLRDKLIGYQNAGMLLDQARIIAGISDGLRNRAAMKRPDMDIAWRTFASGLQKQIISKISDSEALIKKLTAGKKAVLSADGMQFYLSRKGHGDKDKNATRTISLTEKIAPEGRVLSQIPHLTLSPDDDMPAIVRDALPLLNSGAEVEVYAIARTVYGSRPLPKNIAPYTVLHYEMKGLGTR
ncbi:hypothetical protein ACU6Z2_12885 [Klebsiella aerogenes]